ncbi:MAG: nucleoside triphosphate pyrophosphohydrolase [Epulopiscium sp. Nele67-Bin005]|nr:MAG: nucleoside triphosphate pyrophosphohydrolase [Epulopiscium sp. Nele67-Bin005]
MDFELKESYKFEDLVAVMKVLRSKDGCPWDIEQTHKSIRNNFLEEVYEAIEAIDTDNTELLKEELGDVLLQVVFHAEIEAEVNKFDIDDVCNGICQKLIYRHPHIFANVTVNNSQEVLSNWEELKKKEKGHSTTSESMKSISTSLPAMMRAEKIQKKAAKVGFDFEDGHDALGKVKEEIFEAIDALEGNGNLEEELGDVFFALVNATRHLGFDSDRLLSQTSDKFIRRFSYVEEKIIESGLEMKDASVDDMEKFWQEKKVLEKKGE